VRCASVRTPDTPYVPVLSSALDDAFPRYPGPGLGGLAIMASRESVVVISQASAEGSRRLSDQIKSGTI
jgi:hypothetical protein